MMPIFLDTVGLIAIWDDTDQWHPLAYLAYAEIAEAGVNVVTTPLILYECGNSSTRRPYRKKVNEMRQWLEQSNRLIAPNPEDIDAAWAAYDRGEANNAGIVDQISFAVMRRLGLTQAFTNDAHFRAAGFGTMF